MTVAAESRVMSLDTAHNVSDGNIAFRRWAICVAGIYGVVTCSVAAIAVLLALSAQPVAQISKGYSPQFSREFPVAPSTTVDAQ